MSKATERCDSLPGCNYAIWQDSEEFCFTTDAVFLAAFPHLVRQARVLELGAGTGAISLLLAARGAAQVVGVDCNPHVVELMRRSIAANGLEECVSAELADLRELKALYRSESFDLIAANPPYRNSGKVRRVATAACHELTATLEDFFRAAAVSGIRITKKCPFQMVERRTVPEAHQRTFVKDQIAVDFYAVFFRQFFQFPGHLPAHIKEIGLIGLRRKIQSRLHCRRNRHKEIPADF